MRGAVVRQEVSRHDTEVVGEIGNGEEQGEGWHHAMAIQRKVEEGFFISLSA
jgi:hypothetical protein